MTLRGLARTCLTLFAVSSAFPVVAGGINQQRPLGWLGVADVALAAMLVSAVAILVPQARHIVTAADRVAAFRAAQGVAGLNPVLLALYFVVGSRVNWTVLVIGLAWRAWLLVSTLPFLMAALASARGRPADAAAGRGPPRA